MISRRYALLLAALATVLLVSCVISLGFGPARVPVDVVGRILLYKAFGVGEVNWPAGQEHIVWLIRVPRMLLGALVGAGLALIGAVLQAVTRNPLADPHLLGVTSGATLGAVIVVLHVGEIVGLLTLPIAAFIGALASMLVVLAVARAVRLVQISRPLKTIMLSSAPIKAAMGRVSRPTISPTCSTTITAPRVAPLVTPSRCGSARGLRVTACRCSWPQARWYW